MKIEIYFPVARLLSSTQFAAAPTCVGAGFRHHEHIDPDSDCRDVIHEFIDFRVTYLLDDRWVAGICNLLHASAVT